MFFCLIELLLIRLGHSSVSKRHRTGCLEAIAQHGCTAQPRWWAIFQLNQVCAALFPVELLQLHTHWLQLMAGRNTGATFQSGMFLSCFCQSAAEYPPLMQGCPTRTKSIIEIQYS